MPQQQNSAVQLCQKLLNELKWRWDHPRVMDWLGRVGKHDTGKPYSLQDPIPEFVYISLAKFLDCRLRCQQTLDLLGWGWDHEKVRAIEAKYRCLGQLPLRGYQDLFKVLDEAWFFEGGGF